MCGEYEYIDEDGLCPKCETYQPIRRTKELTSLPHTMCVLADVNEERVCHCNQYKLQAIDRWCC
jgi:hypothetical protein